MDLSSIEQIIRTRVPNAPDSDVELYLDSVKRDMGFGADYSDMSEDDIIEDFEFYFQSKMDESKKPSTKMKKSELKEMIKAAFLSEADFTSGQDDDAAPAIASMYDPLYEAEEESLDDILARIAGTKVDPYMAEAQVDMPKINLPAINAKIEDSPRIDIIAAKVQNDPKAMGALNKLASMYGLNKMNELDSSDFRSIEMAARKFASNLQEMEDGDDASLTASGILGGPLLFMAIPGLYEFVLQLIQSMQANPEYVVGTDSLIMFGSVVAGVVVGNILDRIKNKSGAFNEAKEEKVDINIDAEEKIEKPANDSIVVDKRIVSLSSLPSETRKILDSLETLRGQAEEFGDQKFITQVGNTITFFTRDFVVAGDEPTKEKVDETKESLNEDLTSTITILLAFLIGIPGVPIAGALMMGLIDYIFNGLPDQYNEYRSLKSYKGSDKQEEILALAKEIESKLSPGKKRYLKTLVNRIGVAKLEDKAREYRELDIYARGAKSELDDMSDPDYAKRQKELSDYRKRKYAEKVAKVNKAMYGNEDGLEENLNVDIEAALKDLPVPTDMENDKESLNESVAFPLWNKIK